MSGKVVKLRYVGVKAGGITVNLPIGATTLSTIKERVKADPFIDLSEDEAAKLMAREPHNWEYDTGEDDEKNAAKNLEFLLSAEESRLKNLSPAQLAREVRIGGGAPILDEGKLNKGEVKAVREELGTNELAEPDSGKSPGSTAARKQRQAKAKKEEKATAAARKKQKTTVKEVRVKVEK